MKSGSMGSSSMKKGGSMAGMKGGKMGMLAKRTQPKGMKAGMGMKKGTKKY